MKLTRKEVKKLRDEGKTLEEIGRKAGVSKQRISQLMQEWNLPRFKKEEPICPWCTSRNVYYRIKLANFICRHCGRVGKRSQFIKTET